MKCICFSTRNMLYAVLLLLLSSHLCLSQQQPTTQYKRSEKQAQKTVQQVLKSNPVIDGHNDFYHSFYDCSGCTGSVNDFSLDSIQQGNTNIPLYRKGGVGGQFYNIYGRDRKTENLLKAFDLLYSMAEKYPADISIAGSASAMRSAIRSKKIALFPILEGAVLLQDNFPLLHMYYKLGLRSVTFAYKTNNLADGSDDIAKHQGISALGKEMIAEMNRLGIIIDMSHISADAMRGILKTSRAPVIFSHSNAYSLCKVNRNVPDDVLLELRKNNGIIMLNFVPFFISQQHADWLVKAETDWKQKLAELKDTAATDKYYTEVWMKENPEPVVSVRDVADHFDYIKNLIGADYIGIGSDLGDKYDYTIRELSDVSCYPVLLTELARRGWTKKELRKIANENILRVIDAVEKEAAGMK